MKIAADKLSAALDVVCLVARGNSTLPILESVMLTGDDHHLIAVGSDIESEITYTIYAPSDGINFCIDADKLRSIAKKAEGDIDLQIDGNKARIRFGGIRFSLGTLPAADLPRIACGSPSKTLTIPQNALKRMLLWTRESMADRDVRYYLNGALIEINAGTMRIVSTDGHRLSMDCEPIDASFDTGIIIPRAAAITLAKLLEDSDDPVEIAIAGKTLHFTFGCIDYICKAIDGQFPDWRRVVPETTNEVKIDVDAMSRALSRVALCVNEKLQGVRMTISPGLLVIAADNDGEEAIEELRIDYDGKPFESGYNVRYLSDALTAMSVETATLRMGDPKKPLIIEDPAKPERFRLVMPMRI